MSWESVSAEAPLGDLEGSEIAVIGRGLDGRRTSALLRVGKQHGGTVRLWFQDTALRDPLPKPGAATVPAEVSLRAASLAHPLVEVQKAVAVPSVKWPPNTETRWRWLLPALCLATIVLASAIGRGEVLLALIPLLGFWGIQAMRAHGSDPARVIEDGRALPTSQAMAKVSAIETGGLSPTERVAVVRARYGELLSDVVYRIENSALFDAAVPQSQRFQIALLQWDENSPEAYLLADEVDEAFDEAVRNAEELGLDHLPTTAREPAARAAKAARLAIDSKSSGERIAAAKRAAEILSALALYHLPVIEPGSRSLVGERRAIEPGR